jgi:non-ribosomal peptide synthase protein (TIGR01720 family)
LPEYMLPSTWVRLAELPLTPNGKLDRAALPAVGSTRPELESSYEGPRNEVERVLAGIWRELLRVERVGVHDNFFELGGDSILGIQVIARASQALGLQLTVKQLFQQQTIAELAVAAAVGAGARQAEQGPVSGEVELTPIQRWFFEQEVADSHHWNQAVLLEVEERLSAEQWKEVVRGLLQQHDQLRASFSYEQGRWRHRIEELGEWVPFRYQDCEALGEAEFEETLERVGTELQGSFRLSAGPLLRVAYFDRGAKRAGRLLLVGHHLVVDGVSWRIVVEDLEAACRQVQAGERLSLPAKTGSYQQWARWMVESAGGPEWESDRGYWLGARPEGALGLGLELEQEAGENDAGSVETVGEWLEPEETRVLLQEVPRAYHTQINDALLTAILQGYERSTGRRELTIEVEGHGRETGSGQGAMDVSRTVGWFTSIFPVRLELPGSAGVGEALKAVKEQLRAVPRQGMGYGVLRYCSPEEELRGRLRGLGGAQIGFNYLGQVEAGVLGESKLLRLGHENVGPVQSRRARRAHLIDIDGQVVGGRLQLQWSYSRNRHRRQTIEKLASHILKALRALIDHCRTSPLSAFTPSDFPAARLSQRALERILQASHSGAATKGTL